MNNLRDNDTNKAGGMDISNMPVLDLASLSFFNSDPYFNFVYKKSERLCMAIYLITDFFPVGDSIKDNMRKGGTELLKVSLSLITSSSGYRKDILNTISRLCLEIVSLSKVASNLGMTSIPNHNVLEGEIKNFISVIEEKERPDTIGQSFVLKEESFDQVTVGNAENKSKPLVGDENKNEQNIKIERSIVSPGPGKFEKQEKTEAIVKSEAPVKSVMQKNDRQHLILDIIKEIGESSIKDISDNIKDCSEKTIQRELNTLIYDGVLKKIGERRWSKYVLA